jgi:hypothetical protein
MNVVILRGEVVRVSTREVASGRTLLSFDLRSVLADGTVASVPVAWWDPPLIVAEGSDVVVTGAVHRRFFRSGSVTASRTEVMATELVPVRSRKRADRAIARAVEQAMAAS